MQKVLFLEPLFQERIWGGTKLHEEFSYILPSDKTGECWAISAHKNGDCTVKNGELSGKKLSEVYDLCRELFPGTHGEVFPLLTKILDANADLSVQVHPDDDYAFEHVHEQGKTECWYIISCDERAEMILGHHAKTKEELASMVEAKNFDTLLRRIPIKPGDFYYVPAGTVHALCKGTLVLETQQSSDTTYRLYDYDRLDDNGLPRKLHVQEALDVITVPHQSYIYNREITKSNNSLITVFLKTDAFSVEKWIINGNYKRENNNQFFLVSILKGSGHILDEKVQKGDHLIVTGINDKIYCQGNFEAIVSYL